VNKDLGNLQNEIFDITLGGKVMKKKIFILFFLILLSVNVLGGAGKISAGAGDDYVKAWDSGSAISNPVYDVEVGDTDEDGKPEIIAAESHDILPHNAKIHVFENTGDNEYQEVWNSGINLDGMEITSIFLGDADNDGRQEILIGAGSNWSTCKLRIYENAGNNYYQEVWNSANITGDSVAEGVVGDTDEDGKMEIIVGSGGIERMVRVFENIGDNSYQLVREIIGFGKSPQAIIGDQERDGHMEIIVGSQEGENAVRVFEHTGSIGDNIHTEVWNSGTLDGGIYLPTTGDQDHDGKREIIAPCLDAHKVYLFENIGDNNYQEVWNSGNVIGGLVQKAAAGDQDRDGKGEIIASSYEGKVFVFEINQTWPNTQEIFEDFSVCNSDWLEYDPENKIEIDCINDHRLELNHWIRYEPGYVYRPWSTQDFLLEYDINITDDGGNANMIGPGFSDTLGGIWTTQNGAHAVYYAGFGGPQIDIVTFVNGILEWNIGGWGDLPNRIWINTNTTYYVRFEKSENTLKLSIFSDAERTTHISGSPKTVTTSLSSSTFNYFYAVNGPHANPQDNWEWTTGWIDNIHVKKEEIPGGDCLNVGNLTLCADSITQSGNVYTLSGNVNINEKLWFSGKVTYTRKTTTTGTLTSTGYPYVKLSGGKHWIFTAADIIYNVNGNVNNSLGTLELANLNNIVEYALSLVGIPLGITSDPITIKSDSVLIGGRLVIGSGDFILCGVDVDVLYKPGDKAYLQDFHLSADISSTLPWLKTASIELNYDGAADELTGTAVLSFPFLSKNKDENDTIEASIVIQPGCIDGFKISAALAKGIPLGNTGMEIVGLTMEVANICHPPEFYIFFGGDLGITGVPKDVFVLENAGFGYEPLFRLNIQGGTARFLGNPIASLWGYLDASGDPNVTGGYVQGTVNFEVGNFKDFYVADIQMQMLVMLLKFMGHSSGKLQIPDFTCDDFISCIIKSMIEWKVGALPYIIYSQDMYIDVGRENGDWTGSLKGMVSIGDFEFAAALNYTNNELHFLIGSNYEDMIRILDNSQLRVLSNSVEQGITFASNKEDVIFAAVGKTDQPQIYLDTPDGKTITSSNFGNFSGVNYIESNKNFVTLFTLKNAAAGGWTFGVSNLSSSEVTIQILSKRKLSQTSFTQVNQAEDKININVSVNPTAADTKVSFYFSKRASGGTGAPIVENLSASSGIVSTQWNTDSITTGTYYIFAKTTDDLNPPVITYYTSPIVINNSGIEPPTDLQGTRTGSTATLTWKPSTSPTVIGYNVLYTDELDVGGYKYQKSSNYNDQAVMENLDPGKEYCFCVVAFDNNGDFSIESNKYCTAEAGTPEISLNRTSLTFGSLLNGVATSSQRIFISNTQNGTLNWTSFSSESWLQVSPGSGTGDGEMIISANPIGLSAGNYTGTVTISDPNAINSPQTVTVVLNVYNANYSSKPFGEFATPIDNSTVMSSIPVTGWVLDDIGVAGVKIYRGEVGNLVYIGDAVFVDGARPDVEQAYPGYPLNFQAGWGYMMLTNFLPNGGNGKFKIHAIAADTEGHQVTLGTKTITCDNANAVKPFGAIDTPGQGGNASGSIFINWGWVLTPQPNRIPTDGSTIKVFVDGVNLGHPTYNIYREDIATLFPDYTNSDGAVGYFSLDTTHYENGVHTIQWTATDDAGNTDGIGSRYFSIQNTGNTNSSPKTKSGQGGLPPGLDSSTYPNLPPYMPGNVQRDYPIEVITGYNTDVHHNMIYPDENGAVTLEIKELEPLEIHLNSPTCPTWSGFQLIGNQLRALPIGSTFNASKGIFYWQPGPGFIGGYDLVFFNTDAWGQIVKQIVRIVIKPKFIK
jgi:hypothetical protein